MSGSASDPPTKEEPPKEPELDLETLPALFWDGSKEVAEDHPDALAFAALMEDATPLERAESFKDQGNELVKHRMTKNGYFIKQACISYQKAIDEPTGDTKFQSVCHANRAHALLMLGCPTKALEDCKTAISLNPQNVKAFFRASKSSMLIQKYPDCVKFALRGLTLDPKNKELEALRSKAQGKLEARQRYAANRQEEAERALAAAETLRATLQQRGVRMGADEYGAGGYRPRIGEDGNLVWRVSLLVAEHMQSEHIEEVNEGHVLDDHLDLMFGPDTPSPPWDDNEDYTRERVELYFKFQPASAELSANDMTRWLTRGTSAAPSVTSEDDSNDKKDWSKGAEGKWVKVDTSLTLSEVLAQPGFVVPGFPVFHVVAARSEFKKRFLSGQWGGPE